MNSNFSLRCSEVPSENIETKIENDVDNLSFYKTYQFTYTSNTLLKSAALDILDLPLLKMLRGVCRVFMLNEIEIVTWYLVNKRSDWGRLSKHLKYDAFHNFVDFLQITTVGNVSKYKQTLLFLCCSANYVKSVMNHDEHLQKLIYEQVNTFIKVSCFKGLAQNLGRAFDEIYKNISLVQVNRTYQQLLMRQVKVDENKILQYEDDYGQVVDQILEMAPPYQKEDVKPLKKVTRMKKSHKKRKEEEKIEPEVIQLFKEEYVAPVNYSGSSLLMRFSEASGDFMRRMQSKN